MNKRFLRPLIIAVTVCLLVSCMAFVGCSQKSAVSGDNKLHIADTTPLGGDKLLDDGGAINSKGSSFAFRGARYAEEAEHRISFVNNEDKYEFFGGQTRGAWNNSDSSFGRIQVTAASKGAIFEFDFSDVEDTANIGCRVNLIACRGSVLFSVSADKENWTDIGFNTPEGIRCDAKMHLDELSDKNVNDKNLYAMYFLLGEYLNESKVLYLRAGFSRDYFQGADKANNGIGADLIDYVAYYDAVTLYGAVI